MGIIDQLKQRFSSGSDYKINPQFEELIEELKEEIRAETNYYISPELGKYETYAKIQGLGDPDKKNFFKYVVELHIAAAKKSFRKGYRSSDDIGTLYEGIYSSLVHLMPRSNLQLSDKDYKEIYTTFIQADRKKRISLHFLPLGLITQQLVRSVKKNGLSEELKSFIQEMLNWKEFALHDSLFAADLSKISKKLKAIVLSDQGDENQIIPYILERDQLGLQVNPMVDSSDVDLKNSLYELFHQFGKSSGSKPSKKISKSVGETIDKIGNPQYKKWAHSLLDILNTIKGTEEVKTHTYDDGTTYSWNDFLYLHDDNKAWVKGFVWSLTRYHDTQTITELAKLAELTFQKIPGIGARAAVVGNACIYSLSNSKGLDGIGQLSRLKLVVPQNSTKALIDKYLLVESDKRGISMEEIEEIAVPDFGLTNGEKAVEFEDFQFRIRILGIGKVEQAWVKPDGTIQKTAPAIIKQSSTFKKKLSKLKEEVKQIKKHLSAQRDRIDRSMIQERYLSMEGFSKYYLNHGLIGFLARKLIWQLNKEGKTQAAFWHEGEWIDVEGTQIKDIDDATEVRLWHPIYSGLDDIVAWRERLMKLEIKQPLKQAYREIYLLTEAEINTKTYSNRMAAHILKQHQFNALTSIRGWKYSLIGGFDYGDSATIARKEFPQHQLEAQFWIDEINQEDAMTDAGIWTYISTDQVRFEDHKGEPVELIDIPKMLFSEIMRDVDLFVGVSSVGNDPEWRDNGGMPQYRDYWTSYSFGDLNEVAKTRKGILEGLVPRLKIRDVATIEGKFLKVKGKLRTYKIHIGSTNILMEPNDQYLCIVPARGKDKNTENLFLPFEGDRGLSVILSKAFMLAEDTKITDSTITSQINR